MQLINFNIPPSWHEWADVPVKWQEWQFLDNLYAYQQSLNLNYKLKYNIKISESFDHSADINVLVRFIPDHEWTGDTEHYDLNIVTNDHEPLLVTTPYMKHTLDSQPNTFIVANSWLHGEHKYYKQVIPSIGNTTRAIMYWTNGFYPHSYENLVNESLPRTKDLIFINGRNESWRYHAWHSLNQAGSQIPVLSNFQKNIVNTWPGQFESAADTAFRHHVDELYPVVESTDIEKQQMYSKFVTVGIDKKFGQVSFAYTILPEYFGYRCVIFPESSWQNDELALTEKICKCFYAESLPWPIGGSNVNKLYNDLGFYTAWNILPDNLKVFDSIKDHSIRYQELVRAVLWLENNPEILQSQEVKNMLKQNKENFLLSRYSLLCVQRFSKIIDDVIDKKSKL